MPWIAGFHHRIDIGALDRQVGEHPLVKDFDDIALGCADQPRQMAEHRPAGPRSRSAALPRARPGSSPRISTWAQQPGIDVAAGDLQYDILARRNGRGSR